MLKTKLLISYIMKTLLTKTKAKIALFVALLAQASTALAQGGSPFIRQEDCIPGLTCAGDFRATVIAYINYFLAFLGLLAVAFIIYAGILMVTAAGDEEAVTKGKNIILYAAIGIIIILLAWTIVNFVIGVGQTV